MKRLVFGLLVVISLALAAIYIFIPKNITVSKIDLVDCNLEGAVRILSQQSDWKKWWTNDKGSSPSGFSVKKNSFHYKKTSFKITKVMHNSIEVLIDDSYYRTSSVINILPFNTDSIALRWVTTIASGLNPFERIKHYQQAVSIKEDMTAIFFNLHSFLKKKENVYGINIQKTSTIDTLLVAARSVSQNYPSTIVIYDAIKMLQQFILKKGARQTGSPMANITKSGSVYTYMVAVPTNVPLQAEGNIFLRKMIPGDFLVTEVKGGNNAVNQAMDNMQMYIADYKKTAMAIPFLSLVTDRSKEPDSTKWITKIYFPIFY